MPHQCVKCSIVYDNSSPELLTGCKCGGRIFLFLRGQPRTTAGALPSPVALSAEQKADIQAQAKPLADASGTPVTLDFDVENLKVLSAGHYAINLKALLSGEPLVVKNSQGVYFVKFPLTHNPKTKKRASSKDVDLA